MEEGLGRSYKGVQDDQHLDQSSGAEDDDMSE